METGILSPQIYEKRYKKSKTVDLGSSDTKVKSSKKTKQVPIIEPKPIHPDPIIPDTQVIEKEVIPSKTGVFRRIKMKSKSKRISSSANVVRKTQVSHQGVIFWEIPTPVSQSSKKTMAANMAKHISKKKQRKLVFSSYSTADEIEVIPETPETVLIKEFFKADTSVTQPPEVLIAKTVTVEARSSDFPRNISDMDKNVIMGENTSNDAAKGACFHWWRVGEGSKGHVAEGESENPRIPFSFMVSIITNQVFIERSVEQALLQDGWGAGSILVQYTSIHGIVHTPQGRLLCPRSMKARVHRLLSFQQLIIKISSKYSHF
ncbi:unnamed protein product [Lactuca saligna]|uniref:Uncharacterized protein n=1 Tax=Lactuca saligna TaxID=75948 RepID=A0AA36A1P1_LACSI|nr:unnamed protein product [Lactuca saligna]